MPAFLTLSQVKSGVDTTRALALRTQRDLIHSGICDQTDGLGTSITALHYLGVCRRTVAASRRRMWQSNPVPCLQVTN